MTLIDHMVSSQIGLITQVAGALTHTRFWEATVFMYHYSDYGYTYLTRVTSTEEILWSKEAYEHLATTHGARVCAYRGYNGRLTETQLKEAVQTCEH